MPTAIAASIALPPFFIISTPICEASGCCEATIACFPRTGSRVAAGVAIGISPAANEIKINNAQIDLIRIGVIFSS